MYTNKAKLSSSKHLTSLPLTLLPTKLKSASMQESDITFSMSSSTMLLKRAMLRWQDVAPIALSRNFEHLSWFEISKCLSTANLTTTTQLMRVHCQPHLVSLPQKGHSAPLLILQPYRDQKLLFCLQPTKQTACSVLAHNSEPSYTSYCWVLRDACILRSQKQQFGSKNQDQMILWSPKSNLE